MKRDFCTVKMEKPLFPESLVFVEMSGFVRFSIFDLLACVGMTPFAEALYSPFLRCAEEKIRKPPVYHQAASYVGIALKHTQFDCNSIISAARGCVKQILSTTFGRIRGVAALGGGWKACEERGLAKKKGCHHVDDTPSAPLQNLSKSLEIQAGNAQISWYSGCGS